MNTVDARIQRLVKSLASDRQDLSRFQEKLRSEGFFRLFASLIANPVIPKSVGAKRPLKWDIIPNCQLLLTRMWSPLVEDEKVSGYVLDKSLVGNGILQVQLDLLAKIGFEIIGRHNTLSERIVHSASRNKHFMPGGTCLFHLRHDSDAKQPLSFSVSTQSLTCYDLSYSPDVRRKLITHSKHGKSVNLPGLFQCSVAKFANMNTKPIHYPALARSLRRKLRQIATDTDALEHSRKNALAEIAGNVNALGALHKATALLRDPTADRIVPSKKADIAHWHHEYLDFLGVIQAGLLFAPWHHYAACLTVAVDENAPKCICLVAVGTHPILDQDLGKAEVIAKKFLQKAVVQQEALKKCRDSQSVSLRDELLKDKPRKQLTKPLLRGYDPDERVKQLHIVRVIMKKLVKDPKISSKFSGAPVVGLSMLISQMGEVSNYIHEGTPCRFLLLFGPGRCWRLFNETVSREDIRDMPLSRILKSNYSVFQNPPVAGFVDANVHPDGRGINYLGLLRDVPDEAWMRRTTKRFKGLFVLSSSGDGIVRIYGEGALLGKWRHESGVLGLPNTLRKDQLKKAFTGKPVWIDELFEALSQIEETPGEGALIVVARHADINACISPMESRTLQMEWAKLDSLEYTDLMLIRALFRRDGASVISPNGDMQLRYLVFPVDPRTRGAARKIDFEGNLGKVKHLLGRGARHLTAENLSKVLGRKKHLILSLSVDGGVKIWPRGRR
ncbi:MAG TPA: hypothetical protein VJZ71_19985 [Phycisphaerae bacterium]|nr:hypothetical protein [Phycisphaerae bacterium]